MTDELTGSLTDGERYRFEADGFLVVERALPPDHVGALREALADAAAQAADYGSEHQGDDLLVASGQLRTVSNPLARCPSVLDAALHPGFFPKISDLFRGRARLLSTKFLVTPPRSKPRLSWHRDADQRNYAGIDLADSLVSVNALVLLSDVGPENGPTLAIPGSHRWPEERSVPPGAQDPRTSPATSRSAAAGRRRCSSTRAYPTRSPRTRATASVACSCSSTGTAGCAPSTATCPPATRLRRLRTRR